MVGAAAAALAKAYFSGRSWGQGLVSGQEEVVVGAVATVPGQPGGRAVVGPGTWSPDARTGGAGRGQRGLVLGRTSRSGQARE